MSVAAGGWSRLGRERLSLPSHRSTEGRAPRPACSCQTCIVTHESNGIDIITALILNDISPLCKYRMDLVLQLKVGPGAALVRVHVMRACASMWCRQVVCV